MTVAVMQPYIFPYLGYYQLVNAVDTFVFFDDVNYINKGWINRNNILQQNHALRFTIPLLKASQNKFIKEIEIADYNKWHTAFLKTIEISYKKAPHFKVISEWLNEFFSQKYFLISELTAQSIIAIANLLQISTDFKNSASLQYRKGEEQNGQMKVLEICNILGANNYINPKNGTELYDRKIFEERAIALMFINMKEITYSQFTTGEFVPYLSIIDVLMFNGISGTKELINQYTLN